MADHEREKKSASAFPEGKESRSQGTELTGNESVSQESGLVQVINVLADRIDPVIKITSTIAEKYIHAKESRAKFSIRMAWIAVFVVTLIVAVAGVLTYFGKIDGSTFTFLLGLIIGYVLTFIRDSIAPSSE